jgi:hypothetical protein
MTKHLLATGILTIAATLISVLSQAVRNERISFSMHAAQSFRTYLMFAIGLTTAAACWGVWMAGWFMPQFHPGLVFTSVFFTALGLMLVAAWVRWERGTKGKVHDRAAYSMAYLMPILPAALVLNAHISTASRYICGGVLVAQITLLYLLIFVPILRHHFLRFQLAYIALTFAALLSATYVR